jgi:hypothetical protein
MQAAVVSGRHRVREARADGIVGFAVALFQQPARADVAAGLLIIAEVQFAAAGEP